MENIKQGNLKKAPVQMNTENVSQQEKELMKRLIDLKTQEIRELKNVRYETTRVSHEWQKIANDLNQQDYSFEFILEYLKLLKEKIVQDNIVIYDNLPFETPNVTIDFINLIEKQIAQVELKKIQFLKKKELQTQTTKEANNEYFIDLSNTKDINKVRYLIELGVVDYLQKNVFTHSNNALASALSGVTGIKETTIQPYINAYLTKSSDKNNPMNITNEVNKIVQTLTKLGYSKPK